jgi:hemoglobin
MTQESLYKRMGGYDTIAAITDDFLTKLVAHEQMKRFFFGASESTRTRRRQHIVDFICAKTGGPCAYTGRSMKDSHKGLSITEDDWNTLLELFLQSLKKCGLRHSESQDLMDLISSLKSDILESS